METGDKNGKRTLLAHGRPVVDNRERIPLKQQRAVNACGHQGGEGERVTLTRQRMPTARSQGPEGDPHTWQHAPLAHGRGMEEEGVPPTQQRVQTARSQGSTGATPTSQRATPARSQGGEEEGDSPKLQRSHHARRQGR